MKEKDIHVLIESQNDDAKKRIAQNVLRQIPQDVPSRFRRPVSQWGWKIATVALALICVLTLAIFLPLTLSPAGEATPPINAGTDTPPQENNPPQEVKPPQVNPPQVDPPKADDNRYCAGSESAFEQLDCTLKEYSENNGLNLLYLDWYDVAEEVLARRGFMIVDSTDTIYVEEVIANAETGDIVTLAITHKNTTVESFHVYDTCNRKLSVGDLTVLWRNNMHDSIATFEYGEYAYYLNVDSPDATELLEEIVANMLSNQK